MGAISWVPSISYHLVVNILYSDGLYTDSSKEVTTINEVKNYQTFFFFFLLDKETRPAHKVAGNLSIEKCYRFHTDLAKSRRR